MPIENQQAEENQNAPQVRPEDSPLVRATDLMWKRMLMILGAAFLFIILCGTIGFCGI